MRRLSGRSSSASKSGAPSRRRRDEERNHGARGAPSRWLPSVGDGGRVSSPVTNGQRVEGGLAGSEELDDHRHRPEVEGRLVVPDLGVEDLPLEQGARGGDVARLVGVPVGLEERRDPEQGEERDRPAQPEPRAPEPVGGWRPAAAGRPPAAAAIAVLLGLGRSGRRSAPQPGEPPIHPPAGNLARALTGRGCVIVPPRGRRAGASPPSATPPGPRRPAPSHPRRPGRGRRADRGPGGDLPPGRRSRLLVAHGDRAAGSSATARSPATSSSPTR